MATCLRCAAVIGLCASAFPAAAASAAEHVKVVQGGTLSGNQVRDLVTRYRTVRLKALTVHGPVLLSGRYNLTTDGVHFADDVAGNVDADQAFYARRTRFDSVVALVAAKPCGHCRLEIGSDGSTFTTGLVLDSSDSGTPIAVDLLRARLIGPSAVRGFASFRCFLCQVDGNLTLSARHADLVELGDTSGKAAVTLERGAIDQFELHGTRLDQAIDIEGASFGALHIPCRRSQTIFVRWDQLRASWLEPAMRELGTEEEPRAVAQALRRDALCWRDQLKTNGREADARKANHAAIELNRDYVLTRFGLDWWAAWALELPTSYGTAPWRLLIISLAVIVLCGLVYIVTDPFETAPTASPRPKTPLWLFGLLFSVETFVPVLQVTGIKQWGWRIGTSRLRWLEALEGLMGGILVLLAGYSLASYVF